MNSSYLRVFINRHFSFIVFCLALAISLNVLLAGRGCGLLPMPVKGMDQYTILVTAGNLYNGHLPDKPYFFSPSYTLFVTCLIALTSGDVFFMRLLQAVICAFTPVFIFKLSRLLRVPVNASQLSAILFCFYGPGVLLSLGFLRAAVLGLAFLIYVYALVRAFLRRKSGWYVFAGFMGVVCLLGRPNFIPIIILPVAAFLLPALRKHIRRRFVIAYFSVIAIIILPFMLYNKVRFDSFSISPGHTRNIIRDSGYFDGRKSDSAYDIALFALKKLPRNIYQFSSSYEYPNSFSFYAHRDLIDFLWILLVPFNVIFLLALVGGVFSWRNYGVLTVSVFSCAYIVSMIVFAIFYRFRFPVTPLLCVLAGIGFIKLVRWHRKGLKAVVAVCLVILFFLTFQDPDKQRTHRELTATARVMINNKDYLRAISYLERLDRLGVQTKPYWKQLYLMLVQEGDSQLAESIKQKLGR